MIDKRRKFEEAFKRFSDAEHDVVRCFDSEFRELDEDQQLEGIIEKESVVDEARKNAATHANEFFADFSFASANVAERADLANKATELRLVEPLKKLLNDAGVSVEEKKELLKNENCNILRFLVTQGVSFKSFTKDNKKVYQLGDFSELEFQEDDAKNVYNNFYIVTELLRQGRYSEFFDVYDFCKVSNSLELSQLFCAFIFDNFYKVSSDTIDQKELKEILTRMKSALADSRKNFAQPVTNQKFAKVLSIVFCSEYMLTSNDFSKEVLKFIVDALSTLDEKDRAEVLSAKSSIYGYVLSKNPPVSIYHFVEKEKGSTLLKQLALLSEVVGDFKSFGKVASCLTAEQKIKALEEPCLYREYFTAQQVIDNHVKTMHSKDYHFKYCATALCIASVFAFASIKYFARFSDVSNHTKAVLSVGSVILGVLIANELYNTPDDSRYGLKGLSSFSR